MAQDVEWKTVDTEINSFEVPSDWINSFYEEPGTEYKKKVSEKYGFRSWIIAWKKKAPVEEAPVEEILAEAAPVEEAPAEEAPVEEAPADKTVEVETNEEDNH